MWSHEYLLAACDSSLLRLPTSHYLFLLVTVLTWVGQIIFCIHIVVFIPPNRDEISNITKKHEAPSKLLLIVFAVFIQYMVLILSIRPSLSVFKVEFPSGIHQVSIRYFRMHPLSKFVKDLSSTSLLQVYIWGALTFNCHFSTAICLTAHKILSCSCCLVVWIPALVFNWWTRIVLVRISFIFVV